MFWRNERQLEKKTRKKILQKIRKILMHVKKSVLTINKIKNEWKVLLGQKCNKSFHYVVSWGQLHQLQLTWKTLKFDQHYQRWSWNKILNNVENLKITKEKDPILSSICNILQKNVFQQLLTRMVSWKAPFLNKILDNKCK